MKRKAADFVETPLVDDSPAMELQATQADLGFERTRMAADQTLMGIVCTSLTLIGFGFTIHTAFQKLAETAVLPLNEDSPRNFGVALIVIGIAMLILGIRAHVHFQRQLNAHRSRLMAQRLMRAAIDYRVSPSFATAWALLLVGLAALAVIVFNILV